MEQNVHWRSVAHAAALVAEASAAALVAEASAAALVRSSALHIWQQIAGQSRGVRLVGAQPAVSPSGLNAVPTEPAAGVAILSASALS